jgi:hypothetical protein
MTTTETKPAAAGWCLGVMCLRWPAPRLNGLGPGQLWMPAVAHSAAYRAAHKLEADTNLSAMTVAFTFSVVTHSGVSSAAGTDVPVCGSVYAREPLWARDGLHVGHGLVLGA